MKITCFSISLKYNKDMKSKQSFKKYSVIAAIFIFSTALYSCAPTISYEQANDIFNVVKESHQDGKYVADKYSFELNSFDTTIMDNNKTTYDVKIMVTVDKELNYGRYFRKETITYYATKQKTINIEEKYVVNHNSNYRFGDRRYQGNEMVYEEETINASWIEKNEMIASIDWHPAFLLNNIFIVSKNILDNYYFATPYHNTTFKSKDDSSLILGAKISTEERGLNVTTDYTINYENYKLSNAKYFITKKAGNTDVKQNLNYSYKYDNLKYDSRVFQDIETYLK